MLLHRLRCDAVYKIQMQTNVYLLTKVLYLCHPYIGLRSAYLSLSLFAARATSNEARRAAVDFSTFSRCPFGSRCALVVVRQTRRSVGAAEDVDPGVKLCRRRTVSSGGASDAARVTVTAGRPRGSCTLPRRLRVDSLLCRSDSDITDCRLYLHAINAHVRTDPSCQLPDNISNSLCADQSFF